MTFFTNLTLFQDTSRAPSATQSIVPTISVIGPGSAAKGESSKQEQPSEVHSTLSLKRSPSPKSPSKPSTHDQHVVKFLK